MIPSIGRIVRFVLPSGQIRPAIVVRVLSEKPDEKSQLSLNVFVEEDDGFNRSPVLRGPITADQAGKAGNTWHWAEDQAPTAPVDTKTEKEPVVPTAAPTPEIKPAPTTNK